MLLFDILSFHLEGLPSAFLVRLGARCVGGSILPPLGALASKGTPLSTGLCWIEGGAMWVKRNCSVSFLVCLLHLGTIASQLDSGALIRNFSSMDGCSIIVSVGYKGWGLRVSRQWEQLFFNSDYICFQCIGKSNIKGNFFLIMMMQIIFLQN